MLSIHVMPPTETEGHFSVPMPITLIFVEHQGNIVPLNHLEDVILVTTAFMIPRATTINRQVVTIIAETTLQVQHIVHSHVLLV